MQQYIDGRISKGDKTGRGDSIFFLFSEFLNANL